MLDRISSFNRDVFRALRPLTGKIGGLARAIETVAVVLVAAFTYNVAEYTQELAELNERMVAMEIERNVPTIEQRHVEFAGNDSAPELMILIANTGHRSTELTSARVRWHYLLPNETRPQHVSESLYPVRVDRPGSALLEPGQLGLYRLQKLIVNPTDFEWATLNLTITPVLGEPAIFYWDTEEFQLARGRLWSSLGLKIHVFVSDGEYRVIKAGANWTEDNPPLPK